MLRANPLPLKWSQKTGQPTKVFSQTFEGIRGMSKRRNFTDQFKAKVALEALRGDKTVQEIAAKHQLHSNQVSTLEAAKPFAVRAMWEHWVGGNPPSLGDAPTPPLTLR